MSRRIIEEVTCGLDGDAAYAELRDSPGPERVVTDQPDATFKPRAVGFMAQIEPVEVEPLTWDGDCA